MLNTDLILQEIDAYSATQPEESYHVHIPAEDGSPRKYLGLSALGDKCELAVWFSWRFCSLPQFPARLLRLFRRGHREEYVFIHLLRGIGFTVHTHDENGKQFKVTDFDGHLSGHEDAVGEAPKKFWLKGKPEPFLIEFKSYNTKRFEKLTKEKVKKADIKYYVQMQCYMGYEELSGALFCAVCKDDDRLYFEWVPFVRKDFRAAVDRAHAVIHAQGQSGLQRVANISSWFECKYCDHHAICYGKAESLKSCRSCKHAVPAAGAKWVCTLGKEFGTLCGKWKDVAK